jgi:Protein of unknown function (DUF3592)
MTTDDPFKPLWEYILGFGAVLVVGWTIRVLKSRADRKLQSVAKNWPYVYGTVEHAEAKVMGDGKTAYWVGELAYSYSVDGDYYSGVHHFSARNEDQAWGMVRGWKERRVAVHYAPDRPSHSVLVMEEQDRPPDTEWADQQWR